MFHSLQCVDKCLKNLTGTLELISRARLLIWLLGWFLYQERLLRGRCRLEVSRFFSESSAKCRAFIAAVGTIGFSVTLRSQPDANSWKTLFIFPTSSSGSYKIFCQDCAYCSLESSRQLFKNKLENIQFHSFLSAVTPNHFRWADSHQ